MIKEYEITINGHSSNYKYYINLGYDVKVRKPFVVKISDLMRGATNKVTAICDVCGDESVKEFREYHTYTKGFTESYYCNRCNKIKLKQDTIQKKKDDGKNEDEIETNLNEFDNDNIEMEIEKPLIPFFKKKVLKCFFSTKTLYTFAIKKLKQQQRPN